MQTWSGQQNSSTPPRRNLVTTILIVFAVLGLIVGFIVGSVTGGTKATTPPITTAHPTATKTPVQKPTVKPTATPTKVQLVGVPSVTKVTYAEQADATTSYTFSAQVIDKNAKPQFITASDVHCKLWLTKDNDATDKALAANNFALLNTINRFKQPFPNEIPNVLTFSSTTPQIQTCGTRGKQTIWTYTLTTILPAGQYYLYIAADWEGTHFNWATRQITVTAAG